MPAQENPSAKNAYKKALFCDPTTGCFRKNFPIIQRRRKNQAKKTDRIAPQYSPEAVTPLFLYGKIFHFYFFCGNQQFSQQPSEMN
jgi:hypothetical protein